jgi:hypothetical protein
MLRIATLDYVSHHPCGDRAGAGELQSVVDEFATRKQKPRREPHPIQDLEQQPLSFLLVSQVTVGPADEDDHRHADHHHQDHTTIRRPYLVECRLSIGMVDRPHPLLRHTSGVEGCLAASVRWGALCLHG